MLNQKDAIKINSKFMIHYVDGWQKKNSGNDNDSNK